MTSIEAVHGWIEYAPTSATTRARRALIVPSACTASPASIVSSHACVLVRRSSPRSPPPLPGHRRLRRRDDRERLVADVNRLQRVLGGVTALGEDRCDGLAGEADLATRERRELGRAIARHPRLGANRARARRQLVARDARRDAGQLAGAARVDPGHAGGGVRAPGGRDG